ncbi:hypothetical protein FRC03_010545 [Tulasnella sp. 419]|nr:hypothetical protein FRC03_010545 [Tulasnella sp. 419]
MPSTFIPSSATRNPVSRLRQAPLRYYLYICRTAARSSQANSRSWAEILRPEQRWLLTYSPHLALLHWILPLAYGA